MHQPFRHLDTIGGLFVAVLLISNIASAKILDLGWFTFDGGTLLFPFSYIFGDILTEVYGYARSRKVIWLGFAGAALLRTWIGMTIRPISIPLAQLVRGKEQLLPPSRVGKNQNLCHLRR